MLKKLRRRLTLLFASIAGLILALMAVAALLATEAQMKQAGYAAFQPIVNAVVNKLQTDHSVSVTWLARTETDESILIHIEDNGHPLSFPGAWQPLSDRNELIAQAQGRAREQYGIDVNTLPSSLLETESTLFEMRGRHGELYLAGVVLIPYSSGWNSNAWQTLTILRDMRSQDAEAWKMRLLFVLFVVAGVAVLVVWSSVFVERILRPIGENHKRQVSFVSAASHELRSPLAVIRASASVIRAGGDAEQFCQNIDRECDRMARLIEDLLLLAGSDAKTWSVALHPVDMDVLLVETAELFYPVAARRKQRLLLELPEDPLPTVEGDAQRLQQTLSVLLDNALSYTPEQGGVTLRAYPAGKGASGRSVTIEVSDTGPGIPAEHTAHIFERFYRADKSRNDKSHFGLGLSIAQELIKLHHGRLTLKSTGPAGTTFAVELPARRDEESR